MVCRHLTIAILTGPTFSGKTGCLARWAAARQDVAGLLSPDGPDGRHFVDLVSGESVPMEARADEPEMVAVGRFRFRAAAFDWANERLFAAASDVRRPIIVIDEIGPIELRGEGLRPGLEAALARLDSPLVLVVRESLVDAVRQAFAIPQASLFTTETWPQAGQDVAAPP